MTTNGELEMESLKRTPDSRLDLRVIPKRPTMCISNIEFPEATQLNTGHIKCFKKEFYGR